MNENITGVILAGGRGTRMGGLDKGLVLLDGRPMAEYAITGLRPQVAEIIISANRHPDRYAQYGHRVVADVEQNFCGPLAGIASALALVTTEYIATVPCDAPMVETNMVERLAQVATRQQVAISVAHDGKRMQPLFMLLARTLAPDIAAFVARGDGEVEDWLATQRYATCHFDDAETFIDVNNADERHAIEHQLRDRRLGFAPLRKKQSPLKRAFREWRARKDSNLRPPGS